MNSFLCCTDLPSGPHTYRLEDLAYTRSGDKGNSVNIGIFLSFAFWRDVVFHIRVTYQVLVLIFSNLAWPLFPVIVLKQKRIFIEYGFY